MKNQSLRVLIVEDSEDDALLIIRELKKGGYHPVYERVETGETMQKALKEKQWDIILCDYKMPEFNAPSAIALLKELNIDIPLIVVTGKIGEETAAECMHSGAKDYIINDNLFRLCPAIDRELQYAEIRNKHRQVESDLRRNEKKYRSILENIQEIYYEVDLAGNLTFFNDSLCRILGYSREELMGMNYRQYEDKESIKNVIQTYNKVYKTGKPIDGFGRQLISKDGTKRYVEVSISLQKDSSGKPIGFRGISCDLTERKQMEDTISQSEDKYRTILDGMDDVYFEVDIKGNITFVNPSSSKMSGYSEQELIGTSFKKINAPDGIEITKQYFGDIYLTGKAGKPFLWKLLKKNGEQGSFELVASLIRDKQGNPIGFRGIGRDVTERKLAEYILQQTLSSLRKAFGTTIQIMVSAVEMRDPYTSGHQVRSADIARAIASELGLSRDTIDGIRLAGSIHDIGKLSIPAEILSKPTKLSDIEFSLVKEHSRVGYEMLKNVESSWPLAQIVYQHHERMNGSGYPRSMKGDEILIEARIMAVADVVESMASHRPYRPALGIDAAMKEIETNKVTLYDPAVADACLKLFREKHYKIP
jgi:PAS domain S-box-containing protein